MDWMRNAVRCMTAGALLYAVCSYGEDSSAPTEDVPLMTLSTSSLRSAFQFPKGVPDIRLKVQRPTFGSLSKLETEWFVQGVEFQLPMEGLWLGVEKDLGEDVRRATFSLKRNF